MTRDEHLKYCKICKNKRFNYNYGIVCAHTNEVADFEGTCNEYIEDYELKNKLNEINVDKSRASLEKRFLNYLIDLITNYALSFVVGAFLGILIALVAPEKVSLFNEDNWLINYLLGFIIVLLYYTMFESATGKTVGKYLTKTKVIDEHGNTPNFSTCLIRSLCRFIPFEAFSFLGSSRVGWHDSLLKTLVVNAK